MGAGEGDRRGHAAVVTAYKDLAMLRELVAALRRRDFRVFVHLDRKGSIDRRQAQALRDMGCHVERRHKVFWGSYSHLQAVVGLIRLAVRAPGVGYVHVISGQDYPIKSRAEIDRICDGRIFIDAEPLAGTSAMVAERFKRYKIFFAIESIRWLYRPLNKISFLAQGLIGVERSGTRAFDDIYKGLIWMSIPAADCAELLERPSAKRLMRDLRLTYLPEEFYFQTLIMNSDLRSRVAADNLRYVDWEARHGQRPAALDLSDLPRLRGTNAIFARKLDSSVSGELLAAIRDR